MYYLSEAWFLSCEDIPLAECAFKISTRPPHYTLAVFGAYLCFFFLAEPNTRLSLSPDWLSILFLSLQRPWVSSWPAVVPHPDTASSKSCQGCASTAVTQTYVTAPPPGTQAHSTTSVHCSASCCWGCGCDAESVWRGWMVTPVDYMGETIFFFVLVTLLSSLSCSHLGLITEWEFYSARCNLWATSKL